MVNKVTLSQSESATEWWRGATLYQIYPRSFLDTSGDGVGDLPGITEKLDHVASLGVDGIWISPFFKSPMQDFGYDVSDYLDVDPMFGSLADFDGLLDRAHELGLKVIIDQVYSHTSDLHAWFEESRQSRDNPKSDWYVWADAKEDGTPPNNWQSVFSCGAWTWDARRCQYYLHNFLPSQPDLNLHNPEVQEALLSVAKFWLDRGVDGFRLDAINCGMHDPLLRDNPPASPEHRLETRPFFMQEHKYNMCHDDLPDVLERLRHLTDQYQGIMTVAEVGAPEPLPVMKEYTHGARRLNTAYSFDFLSAPNVTPGFVQQVLEGWPGEAFEGWPSWAFSNHDAPRAVSRWLAGADEHRRSKLLALLLFSLRGNIFLYQGEELGLPQADVPFERLVDPEGILNWPETMGRDGARTPMPWSPDQSHAGFSTHEPWLPVDDRHLPLAVEAQDQDEDSRLNFVRRVIALRQQSPALRIGDIRFLAADEQLLVFERHSGNERVLCAFNLSGEPAALSKELSKEMSKASRGDVLISVDAAGDRSDKDSIHGAERGTGGGEVVLQPYAGAWVRVE